MRGSSLLAAILLLASPRTLPADGSRPAAAGATLGTVFHPGDVAGGRVRQPNGPFELLLFPLDHGADYIGIVHDDTLAIGDTAWAPDRRFWQDREWCADVTALAWAPDGRHLYVSTGGALGSGAVSRLDLVARRVSRIWPNDRTSTAEQGLGRATEIVGIDLARRILRVRYVAARGRDPILVEVGL